MIHMKRIAALLVILTALLPQSAPAHAQDDKAWLLSQINNLRAQLGLHAYVWNDQLGAAAQQQSLYMAETGHISHTQVNGSTPASRASANGYTGRFVSENIYGGGIAGAADAWNFWINSPVHYAGIAHQRNNEIGIGVASGPNGNFFTLVFGYQSNLNAPPAGDSNNSPPPQDTGGDTSAPPPTQAPRYIPPTRTFTPSPTVPTLTPTATWTGTATWTPSPTWTIPPATSTPIQLPTAQVIALEPSITFRPFPSATPSPTPPAARAEKDGDSSSGNLPWGWILGVSFSVGVLLVATGFFVLRKT